MEKPDLIVPEPADPLQAVSDLAKRLYARVTALEALLVQKGVLTENEIAEYLAKPPETYELG